MRRGLARTRQLDDQRLVVGAAAVFLISDCRQAPTFEYEIVGDRLHLMAKPGAGVAGATTKLAWDVDGDGTPDSDPGTGAPYSTPDLYVLLGDTHARVTLFIENPVTRTTTKVTRAIRLPSDTTGAADSAGPAEKK